MKKTRAVIYEDLVEAEADDSGYTRYETTLLWLEIARLTRRNVMVRSSDLQTVEQQLLNVAFA